MLDELVGTSEISVLCLTSMLGENGNQCPHPNVY